MILTDFHIFEQIKWDVSQGFDLKKIYYMGHSIPISELDGMLEIFTMKLDLEPFTIYYLDHEGKDVKMNYDSYQSVLQVLCIVNSFYSMAIKGEEGKTERDYLKFTHFEGFYEYNDGFAIAFT